MAPVFILSRNASGWWSVDYQMAGEAVSRESIGEGQERQKSEGKYLTLRYSYSSAQDRKLWLDDVHVTGSFYKDTIPPLLIH